MNKKFLKKLLSSSGTALGTNIFVSDFGTKTSRILTKYGSAIKLEGILNTEWIKKNLSLANCNRNKMKFGKNKYSGTESKNFCLELGTQQNKWQKERKYFEYYSITG